MSSHRSLPFCFEVHLSRADQAAYIRVLTVSTWCPQGFTVRSGQMAAHRNLQSKSQGGFWEFRGLRCAVCRKKSTSFKVKTENGGDTFSSPSSPMQQPDIPISPRQESAFKASSLHIPKQDPTLATPTSPTSQVQPAFTSLAPLIATATTTARKLKPLTMA